MDSRRGYVERIRGGILKLRYTPEARLDIKSIQQYVTQDLGNSIAANRIISKLFKCCSNLTRNPMLGMRLSAKTGRETDLRYIICEKYLVFYRVDETTISVIRILDGRMDYLRILFGNVGE